MSNPRLQLKNVGQIEDTDIEFGDLTVLVGPQATGKSIFLQFLRLLVDTGYVIDELRKHGLVWNKDIGHFLDIYLGEGMRGVWRNGDNRSVIIYNDDPIDLSTVIQRRRRSKTESLFFIPAQRVLTLGRGWPRPFSDYGASDPFSVRDFSEKIRLLMETGWGRSEGGEIFPQTRRLKNELRKILDRTVFHGFGLRVDTHGAQKRLVLKAKGAEATLPFMVWSAGQREFVPLLVGFYWLLPPTKVPRRQEVEWVVIEEPEAGLHPNGISAVLLLILDLLARGYRVCLSTHSPHVLDVVWALRVIREHQAPSIKILDLFNTRKTDPMKEMADAVLGKIARVYYFDQKTGRTHDISGLDPGSEEASEAGWGGLSEFSGHVADVVAKVVNA
jgi:energy-coupling factor transporter ATP-binding protein EcfA2